MRYFKVCFVVSLIVSVLISASIAIAGLSVMGPPLPTTLVIFKPAPDQLYGDRQTVEMGVGPKKYKFVLSDAYVDDPTGRVHWPDIWEYVRQHHPNFVVQGMDASLFEKIQPGQKLTVKGVFAPLDRTFEVMGTPQEGEGSPPRTY